MARFNDTRIEAARFQVVQNLQDSRRAKAAPDRLAPFRRLRHADRRAADTIAVADEYLVFKRARYREVLPECRPRQRQGEPRRDDAIVFVREDVNASVRRVVIGLGALVADNE